MHLDTAKVVRKQTKFLSFKHNNKHALYNISKLFFEFISSKAQNHTAPAPRSFSEKIWSTADSNRKLPRDPP